MPTDDRIDRAARVIADRTGVSRDMADGFAEEAAINPTKLARALDEAGLLAPGPLPVSWWRVIGPDGGVWCETSSESEAREKSRTGDVLEQLWETPPRSQWVTVGEVAP